MIDTTRIRELYDCMRYRLKPGQEYRSPYAAILALCDEVDRLRAELDAEREKQDRCTKCNGYGFFQLYGDRSITRVCQDCNGTGKAKVTNGISARSGEKYTVGSENSIGGTGEVKVTK